MTREEHIAGLRAIADLLERIPELPVYEFGLPSFALSGTDEEAFAALDAAGAALEAAGVPFERHDARGRANIEVEVVPGMTYRFSRIDERERAQMKARISYEENIRVDAEPDPGSPCVRGDHARCAGCAQCPQDCHPEPSPLVAYMGAVIDALTAAGIGVRARQVDESGPLIRVELERFDDGRVPIMIWTSTAGWRIGDFTGDRPDAATIRYIGIESVPDPSHVAAAVARWRTAPDHLRRDEPAYGAMVTGTLAERLAWRAGPGGR